jgi:hypothetical protein
MEATPKIRKSKPWWARFLLGLLFIILAVILSTGLQFGYNMLFVKTRPDQTLTKGDDNKMNDMLHSPTAYDFTDAAAMSANFAGAIERIDDRNDCADFTANAMIRLYLEHKAELNQTNKDEIRKTLLNFKYWPKEYDRKDDSMCWWSENHQLLFAVTEYLVAREWPESTFADGDSAVNHLSEAKARINYWMEAKFTYGFSEYYSNNYYPEDIAPMANFIQFAAAEDKDMVSHMKIIMDLIFYDLASQSWKYVNESGKTYYAFMSAAGRMYMDNKSSDDTGNRLRNYIDLVMGNNGTDYESYGSNFFNCFKHMYLSKDSSGQPYYVVPDVIKAIFDDPSSEQIVKASNGLDVKELSDEGLVGMEDQKAMMQFGMEAFSNPEVIDNSIGFMNKYHLFANDMLNDFKIVNLWPLTLTHTLGALSHKLHPSTDGKAIQRGNIYTYQTPYYEMSTNQAYQPGEYGDQQQIELASLGGSLSVYTLQPMRNSSRENYWVGQGRMPYSVQDKNINLSLFTIPSKPGLLEPHVASFTHTYFPVGLFDETDLTHLSQGYVFGRKGNALIAIGAKSDSASAVFQFKNSMDGVTDDILSSDRSKIKASVKALIEASLDLRYDLILNGGSKHAYVTELSSLSAEGSLASFASRLLSNDFAFSSSDFSLSYQSNGHAYKAVYAKSFSVDSAVQNLQYQRYESSYVADGQTERKPKEISLSFLSHQLNLSYQANTRTSA